jgi:CheY-like chemotaxis protein
VILAVDDESLIRSLVKAALERGGFNVLTAASGEEALQVFTTEQDRIELVITDVVMPGMDGTILVRRLHLLRPSLPVLYISGFADRLESVRAPFLSKPFSAAALLGKVRTLLADPPPAI